jgi:hypothetical protein
MPENCIDTGGFERVKYAAAAFKPGYRLKAGRETPPEHGLFESV